MNTSPFAIGITGISGRMGQALRRSLTAAIESGAPASYAGGSSRTIAPNAAAALNDAKDAPLTTDALFTAADCIIDFTKPEALEHHLSLAIRHKKSLVIGTTGLTIAQESAIESAAAHIPIVYAANMSIGVNILLALVEKTAAILDAGFDIEIVETHHKHKIDAPSGTAIALGKAAAKGRDIDLSSHMATERSGVRNKGDIGFAVLRGGDVIGEHTVGFYGPHERIELTHKAGDRSLFAEGAIKAALWLNGKDNGLYTMRDVLGLA